MHISTPKLLTVFALLACAGSLGATVAAPAATASTALASTATASTTTSTATAGGAAEATATVPYGTEGLVTTWTGGKAKFTVSKPQVVTFHEVAFDVTTPTGTKAGAARKPILRATLSVLGVSGDVSADTDVELIYQAPDGTLVATTVPIGVFEPTDWISMHPTTVGPGQRTAGEVFFDTAVDGGQVIARSNGTQQVIWHS